MFGKDALCFFIVLIFFKAFDENDKKTDNFTENFNLCNRCCPRLPVYYRDNIDILTRTQFKRQ